MAAAGAEPPEGRGGKMKVLSEFEFTILDMLVHGAIIGRQDLVDQARIFGVPVREIEASMACLGVARLVAHTGPRHDRKWEATDLWLRRVEVLDAVSQTADTSSICDIVGGEHSKVFADLRWWEFQGRLRSQKAKSDELLFFCVFCFETTAEFIVIAEKNFVAHGVRPHYLGGFHPWVREWWRG
jgi:hypothetical protein